MFKHDLLIPKQELVRVDSKNGRLYQLETGEAFSSVTTVLGKYYGKRNDALKRWQKAVGEEKAEGVRHQAGLRGTAFHDHLESFLKNNPNNPLPNTLMETREIKEILSKNVNLIRAIELPVFSKKLKTAGTLDLLVEWNKVNTLVDFKTSKRKKSKESILSYFTQATVYSIMIYELYGIVVKKIIILMSVDHDQPIIFEENPGNYIDEVRKVFITNREE